MQLTRRSFLTLGSAAMAGAAMSGFVQRSARAFATADPFYKRDAVAQAELIRAGDATAAELFEATVRRIELLNPKLNAVVTKAYEGARERAGNGGFAGPFRGVPTLVKDLTDFSGVRTSSGCRAFMNNMAESNAPIVQAMIDAGLNIVGKSNTPEFGLEATTESLALGPCYNPWDTTRSTGGSSGGAGAAVASGMAPLAHGNDGGGSIRIPASCCGVFGLKPGSGRLIGSADGFSISVQGALSRSVRDSAHFLAATERQMPAPGLTPIGLVEGPSRKRLKIAVSAKGAQGEDPAADVSASVESAAELCRELGHEVVEARLEYDGAKMIETFLVLWSSRPAQVAAQLEQQLGRKVTHQDLEPLTLAFAEQFRNGGQEKLPGAVQHLIAAGEDIRRQMESYDVFMSPVLSHAPPVIGEQGPAVPFEILMERMIPYVAYTPIHNVAGTPAMSVPLYWTDNGLPIGTQFAANVGGEGKLLELAYELELARPWADKWAPMSAANYQG